MKMMITAVSSLMNCLILLISFIGQIVQSLFSKLCNDAETSFMAAPTDPKVDKDFQMKADDHLGKEEIGLMIVANYLILVLIYRV